MGKKQHQKDRLFLTTKEWKEEWGGFKGGRAAAPFKRLPFHCCAIHFTPFEDPVCTDEGTVYDITAIVPYIMKFKKHPVTGEPLQLKDLTRLNFSKNADGEFNCPVMGKVFTEHTHIVAVRTTGNVYCWEAVEELCVKPKNWRDLLTDEPFTRKDIIHIQDPLNLSGRTIDQFDHVKRQLTLDDEEAEAEGANNIRNATEDMKRALGALNTQDAKQAFASGGGGKRAEAARLLAEAKLKAGGGTAAAAGQAHERQTGSGPPSTSGQGAAPSAAAAAPEGGGDWRLRAPERSQDMPAFKPGATTWDTDDHTKPGTAAPGKGSGKAGAKAPPGGGAAAAASSDAANGGKPSPAEWYEAAGHVKYIESASTTGAASRSFTSTAWQPATRNERARTRLQRVPTKKGYVRLHTSLGDLNVELHCDLAPRTSENFLALCDMGYYNGTGGDPTGTGKGGESIFGPTFKDELDSRLVHAGRGVLSMANSGPNTNGSQFFITFKSCRHLDFKHSVFGRVVGGLDVLTAMERTPTDPDDRPTAPITITGATIFTNPFYELEEEEAKAEAAARKQAEKEAAAASDPLTHKVGTWFSKPASDGDGRGAPQPVRSGVGKYISTALLSARAAQPGAQGQQPATTGGAAAAGGKEAGAAGPGEQAGRGAEGVEPPVKKAKVASNGFGDFSGNNGAGASTSTASASPAPASPPAVDGAQQLRSSSPLGGAPAAATREPPQRHTSATKGYGSHPPPRRGVLPLWTDDPIPPLPALPVQRRIFCNRALNMKQIKAIGYDMDYTLAQYKPDTFEGLAHKETVSKLVDVFRYPEELRELDFQWDYMTKGLIIDKERGNILKVDRHNYVKVAYHGFTELPAEMRKTVYNGHHSSGPAGAGVFDESGFAMVDTLFSLAEAYLFMQLVEMKDQDRHEVLRRKSYKDLYRDLRTAVDMCHRDGSLKRAVAANPERFIHRDEHLLHVLETHRASGRVVFLATNSLFDYTNVVMNFLLLGKTGSQKSHEWLKYFDVVMVGCAKPSFFQHRAPLFGVDVHSGMLKNTDNGAPIIPIDEQDMSDAGAAATTASAASGTSFVSLSSMSSMDEVALGGRGGARLGARAGAGGAVPGGGFPPGGNVFQGGWYMDLHKMLGVTEGSQVLYIGDHIYGDIVKSKKDIGWRTMLVVPELELELEKLGRSAKMAEELRQLRQLRDEYDDRIQRLKWSIQGNGGVVTADEQSYLDALQLLAAAEVDRAQLKARHSALLRSHHRQFHPIWGQLMKTGHQNSRFAHQIERYACLYTSHVNNLAFVSPEKSFMGRMDLMAHEWEWQAVDTEGPFGGGAGGVGVMASA
ncbi:hypothetical protein GPECTOR_4g587 [Gonium pectorale]|uniref:RING-type E3 ubiquitin transferase n=1 Tax=Gonium pectorale TaxID=33097 RepID=A0A150GXU3_GONPE|nr:hypothetical protein GPECTOR_4g587 [Gonium pectorale]|eukprot:KXZ54522.1 hypothetical protein GPECTOR_4g587 [Gonium pectorale]